MSNDTIVSFDLRSQERVEKLDNQAEALNMNRSEYLRFLVDESEHSAENLEAEIDRLEEEIDRLEEEKTEKIQNYNQKLEQKRTQISVKKEELEQEEDEKEDVESKLNYLASLLRIGYGVESVSHNPRIGKVQRLSSDYDSEEEVIQEAQSRSSEVDVREYLTEDQIQEAPGDEL